MNKYSFGRRIIFIRFKNLWTMMNLYGCNIDISNFTGLYTNNIPIYLIRVRMALF